MSAFDSFEWFVSAMKKSPSQETVHLIQEARVILQTLRSEDERQRFVAETIERVRGKALAR